MEKKNIWIIFQYAMPPYYEVRPRTNAMSRYLMEKGHNTLIVGGSYLHNLEENLGHGREKFLIREYDGLKFAHIKTCSYHDNGLKRMWSFVQFQTRLYRHAYRIATESGNIPDVVISDGYPLPIYRELKVARKFKAKLVKEVRDLWPESLFAFSSLKRDSLLAKYLFRCERAVYEKADRIVFTAEGAKQYIIDQGWNIEKGGEIDTRKIFYINNGIDIDAFDSDAKRHKYYGSDLFSEKGINLIYTGSIRTANNLDLILCPVAELIDDGEDFRLIIVGDGDQKTMLEKRYSSYRDKIKFVGSVRKEYIPALLEQADICILCYSKADIDRYGGSQNKLFEYMGASKPTLSIITQGFDLIKRHKIGIVVGDQSSKSIKAAIRAFMAMSECERHKMGAVARDVVKQFDFRILSQKMLEVVEGLDYIQ